MLLAVWGWDMSQWILEPQFRAYDPLRGAQYYWTNVYCWLQSDGLTAPDSSVVGPLQSATVGMSKPNATRVNYRVRSFDNTYYSVVSDAQFGSYSGFGSGYLFGWCALLRGYDAADNQVAYKRLRGNWSQADIPGYLLSAELLAYLQGYADNVLAPLPLCSWRGVPVVRWRVAPEAHIWQQRHGSKRAARPVFV